MNPLTRILSAGFFVALLFCALLTQMSATAKDRKKLADNHTDVKGMPSQIAKGKSISVPLLHISSGGTASLPYLSDMQMQSASKRMDEMDESVSLAKCGNRDANQGDWFQAKSEYQAALSLWPNNSSALYGMGRCAQVYGDINSAIRYYRTATYADNSPHSIYNSQTNDPIKLMEFALLLSNGGQDQEALSVYQRAAGLLNYMDGKQNLRVLLPDFYSGKWAYTPQRLRAMARVGLAVGPGNWDDGKALAELQEASRLAPDSPLPYFYKGRTLVGKKGRSRESLAAFRMANQLGNGDTKAAVDKQLKDYDIGRAAEVEQDMEDLQKKQAAQKK